MFFNKKLKRTQAELLQEEESHLQTKNQLKQIGEQNQQTVNRLVSDLKQCSQHNQELLNRYSEFVNKDRVLQERNQEIEAAEARLQELNSKYQGALKVHESLAAELNLYEDTLEIGSFGLYKRQFDFETSELYKAKIEHNYEQQKQLVKQDQAVICTTEWEVGGSRAEGRKMTNQYKKLMLFAFNGECDGIIAKVKWNNVVKVKERIMKAFENVNKLGVTQRCSLTPEYLALKLQELALSYEYEQKKNEEKEEQRRIREQMRDEEKAQKELERAQREAEDEEKRFQKALDRAKQELSSAGASNLDLLNEQVRFLEQKLQEAHERKERAISLAQLTKVGHIYVISNVGSFGDDVYKIGMTRRLDPTDRVKELGDASVPFQFDIHAIIYSENAPQLEYELHKKFSDRRLNRINNKKEFFKVTLDEVEEFVRQHANAEIEFTKLAEAREYRETLTLLKELDNVGVVTEKVSEFPTTLI